MILHSAGHRLPVTSLCAPKGSFPCSDKEITPGLEIEEPVYARRNATESQRGASQKSHPAPGHQWGKETRKFQRRGGSHFWNGEEASLGVILQNYLSPFSTIALTTEQKLNHSLEGTSEFTPKAAGIPVGKSQPPRGANILPRDEVAEVLQCHVPVQILPSRIWLAPLVLRRLLPHP